MDLSTNYLGLSLRSPLVPSASPLSEEMDNIRQMEHRLNHRLDPANRLQDVV
jgi:hypothetical protein